MADDKNDNMEEHMRKSLHLQHVSQASIDEQAEIDALLAKHKSNVHWDTFYEIFPLLRYIFYVLAIVAMMILSLFIRHH